MEFKFGIAKLLRPDASGYTVLDGSRGNPFSSTAGAAQRSSMYFSQGQGPTGAAGNPLNESD